MSYYIIIRGPAAAGKTTLSERLAKKLHAHYISFDRIREEHRIGLSEEDRIKANEIALPEAKKKLEMGQIVIFDGVFYHKSQLEHAIKELPFKHFVFTLKASLQKCLSRHRYRESEISEKSVRYVHKLVTMFDYGIIIDTNKKTDDETIKEILSYLP
jgi:predicted kinase